jgi:hypothetical protein
MDEPIGEDDLDSIDALNYMGIGKDMTLIIVDEAGSLTSQCRRAVLINKYSDVNYGWIQVGIQVNHHLVVVGSACS